VALKKDNGGAKNFGGPLVEHMGWPCKAIHRCYRMNGLPAEPSYYSSYQYRSTYITWHDLYANVWFYVLVFVVVGVLTEWFLRRRERRTKGDV
jgi:hypothetical protein